MRKLSIVSIAGVVLALGGGEAAACGRCDGYAYPYRPIRVSPLGYHELYGFYDSGYRASPGGGFHSVVGPRWSHTGWRKVRRARHR